jgi:8-oxo-dGTP pyrophosphatase MutT (NUDIX family)
MSQRGPLGAPPSIEIEVVTSEVTTDEAFLRVRKLTLVNRHPDGARSAPYRYFMVERDLLDAVCIVLFRRTGPEPELLLRTQLRPPLWFRSEYEVPLLALGTGAVQWEVPAGLVEHGERGEAGLLARAQAETLEETGFALPLERFALLGGPSSLSPGLIAEKLHYVCAEVLAGDQQGAARGDGHAVEEHSVCRFAPLSQVREALRQGQLHDIKSEVALARLRIHLGLD